VNNPGMSPAMHGAVDLSGLVRKKEASENPVAPSTGLVRSVDDRSIGELIELSRTIPVILEIFGGALTPQLAPLIESYQGRFVLGEVRAESAPELVQALQIQGIPTVVAVVGGQPVPLFQGIPPEAEMRPILDQVLELAQKNGVTGTVAPEEPGTEQEADLPPLHQEAYDALARNDIAAAKAAFAKALGQSPADSEAEAGLAQVDLLERVQNLDATAVRSQAADTPHDLEAALQVADLDMVGGHVEDAFVRLLGLYPMVDEDAKEVLRTRILSYFIVAGVTTDVVKRARGQLANFMF